MSEGYALEDYPYLSDEGIEALLRAMKTQVQAMHSVVLMGDLRDEKAGISSADLLSRARDGAPHTARVQS